MKKQISALILGIIIGLLIFGPAFAFAYNKQIEVQFESLKYFFNGEQKYPPAGQSGFIYNDRTYVPLRFIAESLGQQVEWDGSTYSIYIGSKPTTTSSPQPMTSLTPEIIARLQSYPYWGEPKLGFKDINEQRPDLAKIIVEDLFKDIIEFDDNETFFANEQLVYLTWNHHYAIRGVLQVRNDDGTIAEQDVEYIYFYGGWTPPYGYYFDRKRELSEKKIIYAGSVF